MTCVSKVCIELICDLSLQSPSCTIHGMGHEWLPAAFIPLWAHMLALRACLWPRIPVVDSDVVASQIAVKSILFG